MDLLIVAATAAEIAPLEQYLHSHGHVLSGDRYRLGGREVGLCVTGVGSVATAYGLTKALGACRPKLVIQAGIAGAFPAAVALGSVWRVSSDGFADLGAEQGEDLLDLFSLGLLDDNAFPFRDRRLPACPISVPALSGLPAAEAISVSTVSGRPQTIARILRDHPATLESMEGAAFHYVCLMEGLPFLQLRSVSNHVEVRDRSRWQIPRAVAALNEALTRLLETPEPLLIHADHV